MNKIENINSQINKIKKLKVVQNSGHAEELDTLCDRLTDNCINKC